MLHAQTISPVIYELCPEVDPSILTFGSTDASQIIDLRRLAEQKVSTSHAVTFPVEQVDVTSQFAGALN